MILLLTFMETEKFKREEEGKIELADIEPETGRVRTKEEIEEIKKKIKEDPDWWREQK